MTLVCVLKINRFMTLVTSLCTQNKQFNDICVTSLFTFDFHLDFIRWKKNNKETQIEIQGNFPIISSRRFRCTYFVLFSTRHYRIILNSGCLAERTKVSKFLWHLCGFNPHTEQSVAQIGALNRTRTTKQDLHW